MYKIIFVYFFDGFGIYKGDFFTEWVGKIVEKWTGVRTQPFSSYMTKQEKTCFSKERTFLHTSFVRFSRETTPDVPLVVAVRISMSIPFFFKSVEWDKDYYVDGGVLDNYPIRLFDREKFCE
ncbi:patatin-like phospholipase family protein [Bacillus thuringiensis]